MAKDSLRREWKPCSKVELEVVVGAVAAAAVVDESYCGVRVIVPALDDPLIAKDVRSLWMVIISMFPVVRSAPNCGG